VRRKLAQSEFKSPAIKELRYLTAKGRVQFGETLAPRPAAVKQARFPIYTFRETRKPASTIGELGDPRPELLSERVRRGGPRTLSLFQLCLKLADSSGAHEFREDVKPLLLRVCFDELTNEILL
jgi:hypothetical protein